MVLSQVWVSSKELTLGDPSEQFNLLKDEKVYPGQIFSSDEVLLAQEFRDLLHSFADLN